MKIEQIKQELISRLPSILAQLLPGGKISSGRYICGSIDGGEGKSLSVIMSGKDAGSWADFATGQNGDILKLFYYKYGENYKTMIDEAKKAIGIPDFVDASKPQSKYMAPKKTWVPLDEDGPVFEYLTEERKIPPAILKQFDVQEMGDSYVFLFKSPKQGRVCLAKFVSIHLNSKGKKEITASSGGLWCLWGIKQAHTYEDDYVIICEGEIDAMSWASQGFHAVSVPGGAGNLVWIENSFDWLSQFKRIYLSFDMDESGQEHIPTIKQRLGLTRTLVINLPHKDANECLIKGIDLQKYFNEAEETKPAKLVRLADLREEMWQKIILGRREEQGIPFMGWEDDDSIEFRIRPKELTIYTGHAGHGKSAILYQLAAYLIGSFGHKIAIASLEEPAADVSNLILFNLLGKVLQDDSDESVDDFQRAMDIASGKLFLYHHIGVAPVEDIVHWAEYCVSRHGVNHVIIDSVAKTSLDIEDNKEANKFVELITASMNQTMAHYSLVAHSRKGDSNTIHGIPSESDIKGSVQFAISAFNILTVWRNKLKNDLIRAGEKKTKDGKDLDETWGDGIVKVCKQKVGGKVGEFKVWFDRNTYRFRRDYHKQEYPYI